MTSSSSDADRSKAVHALCSQIREELDRLYRVPGLLPDTQNDSSELHKRFEQLVQPYSEASDYKKCIQITQKKFEETSQRYRTLEAKERSDLENESERQDRIFGKQFDNKPIHMQKVCGFDASKYWQL
jgi:hypothetical protein